MKLPVLLAVASFAFAACGQQASPPAEPAAPAPAAAPAQPAAWDPRIPAAFQGRWAADAAACAVEGHESRLIVSAEDLRFHESIGEIRGGTLASPADMTVALDFEGEGETWSRTLRLTLSSDEQTLTIHDPDGAATARVRCRTA